MLKQMWEVFASGIDAARELVQSVRDLASTVREINGETRAAVGLTRKEALDGPPEARKPGRRGN